MSRKINLVISALEKKIMLTECRVFKYKGARLSTGDANTIISYLKRYSAQDYSKSEYDAINYFLTQNKETKNA